MTKWDRGTFRFVPKWDKTKRSPVPLRFHAERADFLTLFWFLFIIAMSWNVIDLLVMDWLLVCTVRPAWLIIPGTENCSSYSDYGHHFKGFLIGCIYTTLMAMIFAGIDYALLYFLMWK